MDSGFTRTVEENEGQAVFVAFINWDKNNTQHDKKLELIIKCNGCLIISEETRNKAKVLFFDGSCLLLSFIYSFRL